MSTTNRAFIKAYRHDAAQAQAATEPASLAAQSPARPSAAPAAAAATGKPAQSGSREQATLTLPATGSRRPLSSFISQSQPAAPPKQEPAGNEILRPGTTVAAFEWPAVCRTLLQRAGGQLDQVIRLIQARADAGNSLVGVLGLFPKVGATTAALCLASRAASRGQRAILADGNFRNPKIASILVAVSTASWDEVLKHAAPLADAVIHSTGDNLDVLALGARPVKEPQPLAAGLQAAVTAGVLRHAYELAIMDLGTFFDPTSQPTLLELISNLGIDAAVVVAGQDPADPRDIATIVEHLDRSGCELLGIIENRIIRPKAA